MEQKSRKKGHKARPGQSSHDHDSIKIKSTVISPPEPTAHPKDFDSIEY